MIAQGTCYFVKGTDTRVAAFRKGSVEAGAINTSIAGNRQHTPRLSRNPQGMGKQARIGIVFSFCDGSLHKRYSISLFG